MLYITRIWLPLLWDRCILQFRCSNQINYAYWRWNSFRFSECLWQLFHSFKVVYKIMVNALLVSIQAEFLQGLVMNFGTVLSWIWIWDIYSDREIHPNPCQRIVFGCIRNTKDYLRFLWISSNNTHISLYLKLAVFNFIRSSYSSVLLFSAIRLYNR